MCSGRKVAIDASMSIYQFLIAVRQDGSTLTNADGETTRFDLTAFKYLIDVTVYVSWTDATKIELNHFCEEEFFRFMGV